MAKRIITIATDNNAGCHGVYLDKKLVVGWQDGDEITRVVSELLLKLGAADLIIQGTFVVDGEIPETVK